MKALHLNLSYLIVLLALAACAPTGRYYQAQDSAPHVIPNQVTTEDAVVTYLPYAKANMRPYTIRGVKYHPLNTGKGYSKQGYASWYGQKFHGHKTSNGEIYDMYQMSAAHKTLPLPSFARVTNLANGKQVVVRINDRGPFHAGRLIDLSYAAALKLDMLKTGLAEVKVDVLHIDKNGNLTVGNQPIIKKAADKQLFVQVAALKNKNKINQLGQALQILYELPFQTKWQNNLYKLQLGPIANETQAKNLLEELHTNGYPHAYKVYVDAT
ncbi:septal ring lytic transglycosylase RlpA family protein [Paraglaciecola aestuariivivens]